MNKKDDTKSFATGCVLSLAICFMCFIYSPFELYFTNKTEFWFDLYVLIPPMLTVFILAAAVNVLIFFAVKKISIGACSILGIAYFIAYICLYIQGNFLVNNLPPLDGTVIDWNLYPRERIKSILVWAIVTAIVLLLLKIFHMNRVQYFTRLIGICMTLMLMITLISVCLTTKGYEKKPNLAVSTGNQFELSKDRNFIILLLDATDSETFNELLETTHPEYADVFADFTYYRNTMGVYSFTMHSIPYILSGDWYENDEDFDEYIEHVYINSDFLKLLEDSSYKLGMYEAEMIPTGEQYMRFENVLPNEYGVTSWWDYTRWTIQMTGFRYAPFDLKKICFVNPNAFIDLKIPPEGYNVFTSSNLLFYNAVKSENVEFTQERCFKFIHIEGAHLPHRYDADVNVIEDATYESSVEASITIAGEYLKKLKENNVYDNSVIIVMADHGFSDDYDDPVYELWRTNPILLVKGVGEKHEMETSDAPISFTDLQEAYGRLLDGVSSDGIFDYEEGEYRERRYLFYHYNEESIMYEYMQSGTAGQRDTLRPTGQEYFYGD